jgi:hypothetical protein
MNRKPQAGKPDGFLIFIAVSRLSARRLPSIYPHIHNMGCV